MSARHALALQPLCRRDLERRHVELTARIRISEGVYVPCIVRNISPMGAGFELADEAVLPLRFRLQIPGDLFEAECELRHCSGRTAGVEFLSHRAEALARYG
ncbi:MAG: PilZ domain-containing protein [Hyphomicrobiaceae bacterium]